MDNHTSCCSICLEDFDNSKRDRRRACLNSCQHLLCRSCVSSLLSNGHEGNGNNQQGGKCPICSKTFRRYYIFDAKTSQIFEAWKSPTFYQPLQENFLSEMYRGFFFEHQIMGFDTAGTETLSSPGRGSSAQRKRLVASLSKRAKTCTKTGHWVESVTDLIEAIDHFFPGSLTMATGRARKYVHVGEQEKEFAGLLKLIFVDPVLEEAKKHQEEERKRETLRLIALAKEKEEMQKQHDKARQKYGKKETGSTSRSSNQAASSGKKGTSSSSSGYSRVVRR